jgi:hypothetical protein
MTKMRENFLYYILYFENHYFPIIFDGFCNNVLSTIEIPWKIIDYCKTPISRKKKIKIHHGEIVSREFCKNVLSFWKIPRKIFDYCKTLREFEIFSKFTTKNLKR